MLVRALLQTSLVLWLAQQTLQGGVKPQSVSWGRVLPARGVGVGVKPGVTGALGALGNRYAAKAAMKAGLGRYSGAQLGLGGYRSLGLGGRTGLKQGAYGASLGTGLGLGTGLPNGLGLGLGQGGKRMYGAGLGTLPGYGALGGIGYPGARPGVLPGYPTGHVSKEQKLGVSAADLGAAEMAGLGQPVQDLRREKSRALGQVRTLGPETPGTRRSPSVPEIRTGVQVQGLNPLVHASSPVAAAALDKPSKGLGLAQIGDGNNPAVLKRKPTVGHEAMLSAGGLSVDQLRRPLGAASSQTERDLSFPQQQRPNCGPSVDLPDIDRYDLLGSEAQRTPSLVPQIPHGKQKHLGLTNPQMQGQNNYQLPQDARGLLYPAQQGPGSRGYLSAASDRPPVKGLLSKGPNVPRTLPLENLQHGPASPQLDGGQQHGPSVPGGSGPPSVGIASIEGREAQDFTADVEYAKLAEHKVKKSKAALPVPGQAGRNTQGTSYIGGAGNYLGAGLGAGGYGAALGAGGYLGGAAGKLGGYGDGTTGYLGAVAGNGLGYGNGYGDGYGAGLGYPSELADVAESKAGKSEALSTGGYAGQGSYGALGAGLDAAGGKYGAAQVPFGNAPVIPAGLEGDGGYPYAAQPLSLTAAEGAKAANKYEAGAGLGPQQAGYDAQLGAAQEALGDQTGKFGGVNGYKG